MTSSQTSRMPWRRQRSARAGRKPGGGTRRPPSAWIASTITAAVSVGGQTVARRWSSWASAASPDRAREVRPVRVGIGQQEQAGPWRRMGLGGVAGDRHREGGAAVIGADEGDDAPPAGRGLDRAHHGLVGVRSGMAEPDPTVAAAGRDRQQPLGQRHGRLVDQGQERWRPASPTRPAPPPRPGPDGRGPGWPRPRRRRSPPPAARRRTSGGGSAPDRAAKGPKRSFSMAAIAAASRAARPSQYTSP